MNTERQLSLFTSSHNLEEDWTFQTADTRQYTHCYHDYPARMIPQIAARLIERYGTDAHLLFDPYCGSGTSLVEANLHGLHAIGTDLNPLARLIAKAKTSLPDLDRLEYWVKVYERSLFNKNLLPPVNIPNEIYGITRLTYWFKPAIIEQLTTLREFIYSIEDELVRLFFQVAFSETVRESSNSRITEFKLYRYDAPTLAQYCPDAFTTMLSKLQRNLKGYKQYRKVIQKYIPPPQTHIYSFNTIEGIPSNYIEEGQVGIVITSPPYGDSHTTVAYGQYSRLSAAWLGLDEPHKIDSKLMGSKKRTCNYRDLPCKSLHNAIEIIGEKDEKRANEVTSFYEDLLTSIAYITKVIQRGGYACYVVGNRSVKGVTLPTDKAITDFFTLHGFKHVRTYTRSIPNKRMPLKNSPSNQVGEVAQTMNREFIIILQREG